MAGGIDWFRWHHGTVTDQKFPLIAKRSGASVAEVIAVWACLLEAASMNENERGLIASEPDFESMDCALGMADGKAEAIFHAMTDRGLVDEHRQVTAWPKRQPKREREDSTAAERKRSQREREAMAGVTDDEAPNETKSRSVTPCHATSHQKTPRGEESREEISEPTVPHPKPAGSGLLRFPPGFDRVWEAYPRKVGKDAAAKAFAKRKPDAALVDAMVAAITVQRLSRDWLKDSGQFIPHLSTWLNEGRWMDEQPGGKGVPIDSDLADLFRRGAA